MARVAVCFGFPAAYGVERRAAPRTRVQTWQDDRAFADIVAPLAHSLRWRLRVRRVTAGSAAGPTLHVAGTVVTALVAATLAALSVSVLVFTIANAYSAPVRWSLVPFG